MGKHGDPNKRRDTNPFRQIFRDFEPGHTGLSTNEDTPPPHSVEPVERTTGDLPIVPFVPELTADEESEEYIHYGAPPVVPPAVWHTGQTEDQGWLGSDESGSIRDEELTADDGRPANRRVGLAILSGALVGSMALGWGIAQAQTSEPLTEPLRAVQTVFVTLSPSPSPKVKSPKPKAASLPIPTVTRWRTRTPAPEVKISYAKVPGPTVRVTRTITPKPKVSIRISVRPAPTVTITKFEFEPFDQDGND